MCQKYELADNNSCIFFPYDTTKSATVKIKYAGISGIRCFYRNFSSSFQLSSGRHGLPLFLSCLLLAEGLAVGTLIHSGVSLVGTHQNTIQGAEVCILAVVCALCNSTLNALVSMTIHRVVPPFPVIVVACPNVQKTYISFMVTIDFFSHSKYNRYGICEFSQILYYERR